jgi:SAM-dependent methyltransferase
MTEHKVDSGRPSDWMRRFAPLIKANGRVLDLACGAGRNARWLAAQGYLVEAVDRDATALQSMHGLANITTKVADLEHAPWPYGVQQFDAIVVCRYLHRPLLPLLPGSLAPQGVLIYETFMQGHEVYGRPQNPDFLLQPNELLEVFMPALTPVAFEQGLLQQKPAAVMQRICAIFNSQASLVDFQFE